MQTEDANLSPRGRAASSDRLADIDRALRLEWLTIGWMIVEAAVALAAGVLAHSLVLEAFGADSVIELLSASVLVWRLRVELKTDTSFPEAIEHRAGRLAGGFLFALTAYIAAGALYGFRLRLRRQASHADIAEWMALERRCCPFLTLHLEFNHDGTTWIDIGGSAAIKAFLEDEFKAVLSA